MRFLVFFCLFLASLTAETRPLEQTGDHPVSAPHASRLFEELEKEEDRGTDFTGELAQLALSLGTILVVLLTLSWFVKRLLHKRIEQTNLTSDIQVLEKRYLNPKAAIYLVKIGNKNLVIGESPQGLVNLGEVRGEISPFEKVMNPLSPA